MARTRNTVLIRVPASTSNLGSGFDTLGLAVNLYTQVRVTMACKAGAKIVSPIAPEDRADAEGMVAEVSREFFACAGISPFGVELSMHGNVPVARGLGFSATARLGMVAALNELSGAAWGRQQLLELVTFLEGHPDNASPAIFGGFTVSGMVGEARSVERGSCQAVRCVRFAVKPELSLVTLIPRFKVNTEKARSLVPENFSRADAVHGLNRAALITAAFAAEAYDSLRGLFDDRIHQPHRETLIPQLSRVIRAGEAAGAIGGFLSGSGSAIICLSLREPQAVAKAMRKELPDSETEILVPDNQGFQIESVDSIVSEGGPMKTFNPRES